jgi:hypothetical protein
MPNLRTVIAIGILAVLAAGGAAAYFFWHGTPDRGTTSEKPFYDVREAAGIHFRTRFLSTEQGKNFKVNLYDHGSGVAVADFDGDGHDDIYFVNQLGKNALYRNRGDGTFEDVTERAGVGLGDRICTAAVFGDYLNEGRQSLFVTSTRGGNVLFRNNGDGTFTDVTKQAGLTHVGHSQAGYFFDYDGDGLLDLLVIQTATWTVDTADTKLKYFPGGSDLFATAGSPREYNLLYHNNGDGTFTNVTEKAGLKGTGWSADAAIFDYDGDGRLDVLIACMFGPSQLYRNNGDQTFTEVTASTLSRTPAGGMGVRAFDYDNDGKLDVYIVDMHSDMWLPVWGDLTQVKDNKRWKFMTITDFQGEDPKFREEDRKFTDLIGLKRDQVIFGNTLHRNLGNGKFEEVGEKANAETFWPWGVVTGDFNNDGYEDAFLPSGMGSPWKYWPNRLLMNMGNGTFREQSRDHGIEPPPGGEEMDEPAWEGRMVRSSRCAAVGDFDGDGRLDIVVNNFNYYPYLFKNRFPRKNYLAFRLRGTQSNRDAIGAVVRVHAGDQIFTRQVNTAGGYLSQSSRTLHFGLGDRTSVDRVEITWPSGSRTTLQAPALNQRHDVVEPEVRAGRVFD